MKSKEEREKIREKNLLIKRENSENIDTLQKRLRGCIKIKKANPDDGQTDYYQRERQVELEYCIKLLLMSKERVRLAKSKNRQKFLLSKERLTIKVTP